MLNLGKLPAPAYTCIAKKMESGGWGAQHIAFLLCVDSQFHKWIFSRAQMVAYVKKYGERAVACAGPLAAAPLAYLRVNHIGSTEYVETIADNRLSNNLLSLPDDPDMNGIRVV